MPGPWFRRSHTQNSVWIADRRRRRLRADSELVRVHYPGLSLLRNGEAAEFVGDITIGSECGIGTQIQTRIVVPDGYPEEEPTAFDVAERFPRDPDAHINPDGSCCLWVWWDSAWDGRQPDALLKFVDQLVVFFHKQLLFEATGRKRWPGDARGHGQDGYKEYLCETLNIAPALLPDFVSLLVSWSDADKYLRCPCGSAKKIRWCHAAAVEGLFRKVGRRVVQARVRSWLNEATPEPTK
jgi:hypothetical protein